MPFGSSLRRGRICSKLSCFGTKANDRDDPESEDHKRHRHHEQNAARVSERSPVSVQTIFARRTG